MLDLLCAIPKEVKFGPHTFKIGPLKLRELGQLQRWIREHAPRPTVVLKDYLALFETEEARRAATLAAVREEKEWPPLIGTAEGNRVILEDLEGQKQFVAILLRKHQAVDDATIETILSGLNAEGLTFLFQVAFGEDDFDPEALRAAIRRAFRGIAPPEIPAPADGSTTAPSLPA